jgi:hypothetical protein
VTVVTLQRGVAPRLHGLAAALRGAVCVDALWGSSVLCTMCCYAASRARGFRAAVGRMWSVRAQGLRHVQRRWR